MTKLDVLVLIEHFLFRREGSNFPLMKMSRLLFFYTRSTGARLDRTERYGKNARPAGPFILRYESLIKRKLKCVFISWF